MMKNDFARLRALLFGIAGLSSTSVMAAAPLLSAMFQDHAVVQRDRPIVVWGDAAAGETVTVAFADQTVSARSDAAGHWRATLPAVAAGGPYVLGVRTSSGAEQTASDVLVGDVFLCSGQSNMGLQVNRAANSYNEIGNADNDSIRLMTVGLAIDTSPQRDFASPVSWKPVTRDTVGDFSAACYFFGRELQKTVKVPLGLINSSWGGSKIEAWMSDAALRAAGGDAAKLDVLKLYATDPDAAGARWGAMWEAWWHSRPQTKGSKDPWSAVTAATDWKIAPMERGAWEKWGIPALENYDGMMWYRTTVRLTAQQAKQKAAISLSQVDEVDQTWINGKPIGNTTGFGGQKIAALEANREKMGRSRVYYLPAGTLKAGENVIVANVLDTWGFGGLYGPAQQRTLMLADGSMIALDNEWRYQLPPSGMGSVPRAPWEAVAGLTTIHNAMISPLGAYGLRGAVWYQGESNTDQPEKYQALLKGLMADWRSQFDAQLPFLIVQLPNYGPVAAAPTQSDWAGLRESQRRAVAEDGNAGLAVTIDIGDRFDIHPAQKQELGRRLARAARHVVYGDSLSPSGPVPATARVEGDRVVVEFSGISGRLQTYSASTASGFELCDTAQCHFVAAVVDGDRALLDATRAQNVTRVRYCWADSPMCNLYDESGLPAGPFEISLNPSSR